MFVWNTLSMKRTNLKEHILFEKQQFGVQYTNSETLKIVYTAEPRKSEISVNPNRM
jgi:hypothetical protein